VIAILMFLAFSLHLAVLHSVTMPASLALPATSLFWAEGSHLGQQPAKVKSQPTTNREQLQACLALPRCEGGRQKSKSPKM
ncbi:MAG: hypothetical protein KBT06_00725, partial [Prevotellaceae bacterium]|nr:hypothetical protein [Candidatus Colivivens equi]